jgi:hypothetical protein
MSRSAPARRYAVPAAGRIAGALASWERHRLAGRRDEAADRVPAELGLKTNLLGPPALIRERLRRYRDAGITTLQAKLAGDRRSRLDTLAQLIELAGEVSREPDHAGREGPAAW